MYRSLLPDDEGTTHVPFSCQFRLLPNICYRLRVTQFVKLGENERIQREAELNDKLILPSFEVEIMLSEIYLDVEFPEPSKNLFLVDR